MNGRLGNIEKQIINIFLKNCCVTRDELQRTFLKHPKKSLVNEIRAEEKNRPEGAVEYYLYGFGIFFASYHACGYIGLKLFCDNAVLTFILSPGLTFLQTITALAFSKA